MQLRFRGHDLILDPAGALFWPGQGLLVVADLHLEKGTAYARRGKLLPPYDSHHTLDRLEALVERYEPATLVSLGDAFHDRAGAREIAPDLFDRLTRLARRQRWLWIAGNHDPEIALSLGGAVLPELCLEGIAFRHVPGGAEGEIAGHLHPKARVHTRRLHLHRPCFAGDDVRLVMPAFGSFTGGLNVLEAAISDLFPTGFFACLLGDTKVFRFPHSVLAPDAQVRAG